MKADNKSPVSEQNVSEADKNGRSVILLQLRMLAGWSGVITGIATMIAGHWLWDSSLKPHLDAQGYWCIGGGAGLVIGSFVYVLFSRRQLRTAGKQQDDPTSQCTTSLTEFSPNSPPDGPRDPYAPPKRP